MSVLSVGRSVCLLVATVNCGKTASSIDLPFGVVSGMRWNNCELDGRAHWRHLANTNERLWTAAMSGLATRLFPNYFGQSCFINVYSWTGFVVSFYAKNRSVVFILKRLCLLSLTQITISHTKFSLKRLLPTWFHYYSTFYFEVILLNFSTIINS